MVVGNCGWFCGRFLVFVDNCGQLWVIVGGCRWLSVVAVGCGWFWVVVGGFLGACGWLWVDRFGWLWIVVDGCILQCNPIKRDLLRKVYLLNFFTFLPKISKVFFLSSQLRIRLQLETFTKFPVAIVGRGGDKAFFTYHVIT